MVQLFENLIGMPSSTADPRFRYCISQPSGPRKRDGYSACDNGLGIESQYERIFGMFQRLHTREEFAGTGIGLAICKKIIERHGGSITVESKPGEGSTFRFALTGIQTKIMQTVSGGEA